MPDVQTQSLERVQGRVLGPFRLGIDRDAHLRGRAGDDRFTERLMRADTVVATIDATLTTN
jgi:hypothetical protein